MVGIKENKQKKSTSGSVYYFLKISFVCAVLAALCLNGYSYSAFISPLDESKSKSCDDASTNDQGVLFNLPPSVKDIVINIGSNTDPIMPTKEMGPCAVAIAVEPVAGHEIPKHRQLHVLHAAVAPKPGVMSMTMYNRRGSLPVLPQRRRTIGGIQEGTGGNFVWYPSSPCRPFSMPFHRRQRSDS